MTEENKETIRLDFILYEAGMGRI